MKAIDSLSTASITLILAGACLCFSAAVMANHPVLVEGEQDYDGDGLLGVDEDNDGNEDQIFGTIGAALAANNRAVNQNGHVIIVTSGRFNEIVSITAEIGDVTLQAAPGVEAEIEAVRAGDANSGARQDAPGIIVDSPANRRVIIRNIVSRNWTDGILIQGESNVLIDNCRFENNRDNNIHITDSASVTIVNSQVNAAGFRRSAANDDTPQPGIGINFEGASRGMVSNTTVTGSFAAGIFAEETVPRIVRVSNNTVFGNNPDVVGVPIR